MHMQSLLTSMFTKANSHAAEENFFANQSREDQHMHRLHCISFHIILSNVNVECIELLTCTHERTLCSFARQWYAFQQQNRSEQSKYAANGCWFNALTIYTFRSTDFTRFVSLALLSSRSKSMPTHFTTSNYTWRCVVLKVCHYASANNKIDAKWNLRLTNPNNSVD